MFAIGLSIAAARTAGAARGLMAAAFYPLMFFSGLYYGFVPAAPLLVLAAYAAGFGYPAMRFFRWE
jgi:hypothetical protein